MIRLTIEDGVAEIVLDAPEKLNSLGPEGIAELSAAYAEASDAGALSSIGALSRWLACAPRCQWNCSLMRASRSVWMGASKPTTKAVCVPHTVGRA